MERKRQRKSRGKGNRTLFTPEALKRFKVFDHIPEQQVHVIPTIGHRFSELSVIPSTTSIFFISGNTGQGNLRNLPKARVAELNV